MIAAETAAVPTSAEPFVRPAPVTGPVYGRTDGLWWRMSGSGRPLVLVQGLGYPAAMFHRLVPLLEAHARVIVYDHRGIGNSARANGLNTLTIGSMAGDLAAIVDDVAGGRADILGISLGGIVAQEFALAYPRQVDRLILACTHTADSRVVLAEAAVFEMMKSRPVMADEEALRSSIPFVYSVHTPSRVIEEDIAIRRRMHHGWDGYRAQLKAATTYEGTSARLPRIHAPTLILHGAEDRFVPAGNASVISERILGSQLHVLPGVSHNFYSEAPEQTAEAILAFLAPPFP